MEIEEIDLTGVPAVTVTQRLDALRQEHRERRFDLAEPPLFRIIVAHLDGDCSRLVLTQHLAAWDGWSELPFFDQLLMLYAQRGDERGLPPTGSYLGYLRWLAGRDRDATRRAWRLALSGLEQPTLVATAASDSGTTLPWPRRTELEPPAEVSEAILAGACAHGVTLNTVLNAAWAVVLSGLAGQQDVVFGTTVSGRPPELADIEHAVGMFLNTIPTRVRIDPAERVPADLSARRRDRWAGCWLLRHHHQLRHPVSPQHRLPDRGAGQGHHADSSWWRGVCRGRPRPASAALLSHRGPTGSRCESSAEQVRGAIERSTRLERELLVAPDYFARLREHAPDIAGADIRIKRGWAHNELTRYRYDVVLSKSPAEVISLAGTFQLIWGEQIADIDALAKVLDQRQPSPLRVARIPNARVASEAAATRALDEDKPITDVLHIFGSGSGIEPEALHELGERLGYRVITTWSNITDGSYDDDSYDAVFITEQANALDGVYQPTAADPDKVDYANDPGGATHCR